MKDAMWSDDKYDYIRLGGKVFMFKRHIETEQEPTPEEQIAAAIIDALLSITLIASVVFVGTIIIGVI